MHHKPLIGGKKPIKPFSFEKGKPLGFGAEGEVFSVRVRVERNGKKRGVTLAEKVFDAGASKRRPELPNFGSAEKQFALMKTISTLNREKKLGLRILPTIRLRTNENGAKSLVLTKIKHEVRAPEKLVGWPPFRVVNRVRFPKYEVTRAEETVIYKEIERMDKILEKQGYATGEDTYLIGRNVKSGAVEVWIADFGKIRPVATKNQN